MIYLHHTALCSRTFKTQCLVFLQTKALAHRMRIIFGLLGLQAAELHGNRTQLQVKILITCPSRDSHMTKWFSCYRE